MRNDWYRDCWTFDSFLRTLSGISLGICRAIKWNPCWVSISFYFSKVLLFSYESISLNFVMFVLDVLLSLYQSYKILNYCAYFEFFAESPSNGVVFLLWFLDYFLILSLVFLKVIVENDNAPHLYSLRALCFLSLIQVPFKWCGWNRKLSCFSLELYIVLMPCFSLANFFMTGNQNYILKLSPLTT